MFDLTKKHRDWNIGETIGEDRREVIGRWEVVVYRAARKALDDLIVGSDLDVILSRVHLEVVISTALPESTHKEPDDE